MKLYARKTVENEHAVQFGTHCKTTKNPKIAGNILHYRELVLKKLATFWQHLGSFLGFEEFKDFLSSWWFIVEVFGKSVVGTRGFEPPTP